LLLLLLLLRRRVAAWPGSPLTLPAAFPAAIVSHRRPLLPLLLLLPIASVPLPAAPTA
jgi:hypothetical protein